MRPIRITRKLWKCNYMEAKRFEKLPDGQDDYSKPVEFGPCNYHTSDERKALNHHNSHGSMRQIR